MILKSKVLSVTHIKVQDSGAQSQSTVDCEVETVIVDCQVLHACVRA
jgi:hypothetical protein